MLIASYLVGYNDDMSVGHMGVDRVFPEETAGAFYELREASLDGEQYFDLLIYFPKAEMPQNLVCLPELPAQVVEQLLEGIAIPVLDFANQCTVDTLRQPLEDRDCA
jgi:hypothetical protein